MIYFLYGPDTYRSRQKLREIVEEYKKRHPSGLNFVRIDFKQNDFQDFKQAVDTVSMFDEKKLIIVEGIFEKSEDFREELRNYLEKRELAEDKDKMIIFWAEKVDFKNKLSQFLKKKAEVQEFRLLGGQQLRNWIRNYIGIHDGNIDNQTIKKLVDYVGSDLWRMSNELDKLVTFKKDVKAENVEELVKPEIDVNIFNTIDALGQRNKKKALKLIQSHFKKGESEMYLLDRFIYQFRNLIKVKAGGGEDLHPFVFRKTSQQARNFSFEELKKIYRKLLEIDLNIKTGKVDAKTALELFVTNL